MARHLEFERTEAVALAADAFWQEGYAALTAIEVAGAMGLAKSSLYNTFGSKKDLFIEAMDHYAGSQRAKVVALSKNEDVIGLLRQMLLEAASDNCAGRGCLLVNTAAEFGSRDEEVRHHVKAGFDGMRDAFAFLIRAGQGIGNINPDVHPQNYAVILVAGIAGLRVLAKGGMSDVELFPVVENLLEGLLN